MGWSLNAASRGREEGGFQKGRSCNPGGSPERASVRWNRLVLRIASANEVIE